MGLFCQWVSFVTVVGLFCQYRGSLLSQLHRVIPNTRTPCSHGQSSISPLHILHLQSSPHVPHTRVHLTLMAVGRWGGRWMWLRAAFAEYTCARACACAWGIMPLACARANIAVMRALSSRVCLRFRSRCVRCRCGGSAGRIRVRRGPGVNSDRKHSH